VALFAGTGTTKARHLISVIRTNDIIDSQVLFLGLDNKKRISTVL